MDSQSGSSILVLKHCTGVGKMSATLTHTHAAGTRVSHNDLKGVTCTSNSSKYFYMQLMLG